MPPLICFYQNCEFIFSDDYKVLALNGTCLFQALAKIEEKYLNELKILQIDFDRKSGHVFILKHYKLLSYDELFNRSASEDHLDLAAKIIFTPQISKDKFIEKVEKIKKDISQGRFYQVNLTSSFSAHLPKQLDGLTLFKAYYPLFRGQYSAYLPLKDYEILCYSPELFLEKKGEQIKTQPIKGTLVENIELLKSEKEQAELSMIVDLLRNDMNSICDKPIVVTQHRKIMDIGYTQHTYSEITGHTNNSLSEILTAMLPGGSISGCPKLESLKAISELEIEPRGFYTGVMGWWQANDCRLNITIRCFKKEKSALTYYAGCGIVYDSDPQKEWLEFLTKAGKLSVNENSNY